MIVVTQVYETNVAPEYAIRGNSVVLKCSIPSFVADFVHVLSWVTDSGQEIYPAQDYGNFLSCIKLTSLNPSSFLIPVRSRCLFQGYSFNLPNRKCDI